jgi:hypothetical protein
MKARGPAVHTMSLVRLRTTRIPAEELEVEADTIAIPSAVDCKKKVEGTRPVDLESAAGEVDGQVSKRVDANRNRCRVVGSYLSDRWNLDSESIQPR